MTSSILTDLKHEIQPYCNLGDLYHHMSINGIDCDQPIHFDGRIHRFSRDSKRSQRDEWYIAYEGISVKGNHYFMVTYGSWSDGSKFTYKSWDGRDYDEKEKEELHREFQRRQEEANLAIVEAHNQSALCALQTWEGSSLEAENESYLKYATSKKITLYCARFGKNPHGFPSIILPLINFEGTIRSLQFISVGEDGTAYKTFLEGGEKKGNYMLLGSIQDGKTIQIAEGYATACDCYKATEWTTIVAFDCGNLKEVVPQLRQRYPCSEIIICADDDAHNPNNPGRTAALEVASQYCLLFYCLSI